MLNLFSALRKGRSFRGATLTSTSVLLAGAALAVAGAAGVFLQVGNPTGAAYLEGEPVYFTSSGSFDKANYPGLRAVRVELVGGGAAGAGANGSGGAGGGAGGYSQELIPSGDLDDSIPVTVGAGGTGVSGADGTPGGTSSFGSHLQATGGVSGAVNGNASAALAGVGSGGDLNLRGGPGSGGSSTFSNGSGAGGGSFFGGGASGHRVGAGSSTGIHALVPGSGGSGASNAGTAAGGNGAPGLVIVTPLY